MMLTMVYWSIEADLSEELNYDLDQDVMIEKSYTKQVKELMKHL